MEKGKGKKGKKKEEEKTREKSLAKFLIEVIIYK
jgi:hypothetical protein